MDAIILVYPVLVLFGILIFCVLWNEEEEERRELSAEERTRSNRDELLKRLEEEMKRAASRVAAEMNALRAKQ